MTTSKKEIHQVKLVGRLKDGSAAKTHQAKDVVGFSDKANDFKCWPGKSGQYNLATALGRYVLEADANANSVYRGILNGVKVQLNVKKVVGLLTYWA